MFMIVLFKTLLIGTIAIIGLMLYRVFKGPSVYDRLNGIFVIGINVIVVLLLVGYTDGRSEMYTDIGISYGILGFVSTVIISKYLGGHRKKDD